MKNWPGISNQIPKTKHSAWLIAGIQQTDGIRGGFKYLFYWLKTSFQSNIIIRELNKYQRLANYGLWAKPGWQPVFVYNVLLRQATHTHSGASRLCLPLCCNGRVGWLLNRDCHLQSWSCVLSDSLQNRAAGPCSKNKALITHEHVHNVMLNVKKKFKKYNAKCR